MSSVVEPNLIKLAIVGAGGVGKSALTVQVRLPSAFPFPFLKGRWSDRIKVTPFSSYSSPSLSSHYSFFKAIF
jgi:hypothetical protein